MKKDVFLSYSSRDAERIEKIVKALEQSGVSVWWDRDIPPGKTWDAVLGKALAEAKCVIVLWTENSVRSDWVKDEAARGKQRKILVPALLDDVEIPLGFGRIEAADLRSWDGNSTDPEFINFLAAIRSFIGKETETGHIQPTHVTPSKVWNFKKLKSAYLLIPILFLIFYYLSLQFSNTNPTQMAIELWRVEGDRATEMLASGTFSKGAGLDQVETWIVRELKALTPEVKTPIKVTLHVPADLKSEDIQYRTEPRVELKTYVNIVSGGSKARPQMSLTRKFVGELEKAFTIEFAKIGYESVPVKIIPGKEKNKTFILKQKKIAVAVEHFENDEKNTATRLSRKLVKNKQLKVLPPDALETLYEEITRIRESFTSNVVIQSAMRSSLGVDFIIRGALEME